MASIRRPVTQGCFVLERYSLRYFTAVVEQGNFSRAAQACNVSQPTLSVGIAKLERELGHSLFVRSSQRVALTAAGARFLVHARRIESEFNLAAAEMGGVTDRPSFRLGVLTSVPGSLIAACIARSAPAAHHRFELLFGSERELVGQLAKGRIDIALTMVARGADRFMEQPIVTERYPLAMPAGHRLAREKVVNGDMLADETMIVRRHCEALSDTSRYFTERGIRPHFALRSTNDERVMQMVAAGLGITVMPSCYRHDGVARPMLAGFGTTRTLGWMATPHAEHLMADPPMLMTEIGRDLVHVVDAEAATGDTASRPGG